MKKGLRTVWNIVTDRLLYTVLYLSASVAWLCPYLGGILDFPMKVLFLWGVFIIAADIFTKRIVFSGYKIFWLILFSASYCVTIFLNPEFFYSGVKYLIYNSLLLFIVYPTDKERLKKDYRKYITVVNDIVILLSLAASVASLVMFFLRISHSLTRGNTTFNLGIYYNRLHGVYTSANIGAFFSIVSITAVLVIYCFNREHFRKWKWFYVTSCIIQYFYYAVTLSNGGYLAYTVLIVLFPVCFFYPFIRKKCKAAVSCLATAAVIVGLFFGFNISLEASRRIIVLPMRIEQSLPNNNNNNNNANSNNPGNNNTVINLERVEDGSDLTNGRFTIWTAGLALLKQKPFFGVCDAEVYDGDTLLAPIDESQLSEKNISELKRARGYMHNAVVQIAVYGGLVGLLVFAVFAVLIIKKFFSAFFGAWNTKYHARFSALLIMLCIMVSQMPAEAHILFRRQDGFAVLFWLYLGFTMFFIAKIEHSNPKKLFICDTPYQVVNTVNMAKKIGDADICVYNQFPTAETVAGNLKKTGVFENVFLLNRYRTYNGLMQKLVTLGRLLFPRAVLKHYTDSPLPGRKYGTVYVSFFSPYVDTVKLLNPHAEFVQYEDGIGSYFIADFENRFCSPLFRFIKSFFLKEQLSYHVKTLYLNNPECYDNTDGKTVAKIPDFTDDGLLEQVFDYRPNTLYVQKKTVYLTQPLTETRIGDAAETVEREILQAVGDKAVLRVHPRQAKEPYAAFTVDTVNNLWELECTKQITDSHVLIGAFSTAQFTPKMLFGKEPTVIFTYKLYGSYFEAAQTTIETLRQMYNNPEKVVVIQTLDELKAVLETL